MMRSDCEDGHQVSMRSVRRKQRVCGARRIVSPHLRSLARTWWTEEHNAGLLVTARGLLHGGSVGASIGASSRAGGGVLVVLLRRHDPDRKEKACVSFFFRCRSASVQRLASTSRLETVTQVRRVTKLESVMVSADSLPAAGTLKSANSDIKFSLLAKRSSRCAHSRSCS